MSIRTHCNSCCGPDLNFSMPFAMSVYLPMSVSGMVHSYVGSTNTLFGAADEEDRERPQAEDSAPPLKRTKLFANYTRASPAPIPSSLQHISKYLEMTDLEDDCLSFWQHNQAALSKLYLPALRALSVPASSAAVERVFSHGGIIMRPHRARMSDKLLSNLVFLKCNSDS